MFDRIILGTANFIHEYNKVKVKDVDKILDYAKELDLYALDTAVAYGTHHMDYPRKIVKLKNGDVYLKSPTENKPLCLMAHDPDAYEHTVREAKNHKVSFGYSVYDFDDLNASGSHSTAPQVIQLPYSIYDRRMEKIFPFLKQNGIEIHARSVFLRGRILEKFSPFEALTFVLMNPMIDRAVIGTESLQMLQDTLEPFREMDEAEETDPYLLDPRKWNGDKT